MELLNTRDKKIQACMDRADKKIEAIKNAPSTEEQKKTLIDKIIKQTDKKINTIIAELEDGTL